MLSKNELRYCVAVWYEPRPRSNDCDEASAVVSCHRGRFKWRGSHLLRVGLLVNGSINFDETLVLVAHLARALAPVVVLGSLAGVAPRLSSRLALRDLLGDMTRNLDITLVLVAHLTRALAPVIVLGSLASVAPRFGDCLALFDCLGLLDLSGSPTLVLVAHLTGALAPVVVLGGLASITPWLSGGLALLELAEGALGDGGVSVVLALVAHVIRSDAPVGVRSLCHTSVACLWVNGWDGKDGSSEERSSGCNRDELHDWVCWLCLTVKKDGCF